MSLYRKDNRRYRHFRRKDDINILTGRRTRSIPLIHLLLEGVEIKDLPRLRLFSDKTHKNHEQNMSQSYT